MMRWLGRAAAVTAGLAAGAVLAAGLPDALAVFEPGLWQVKDDAGQTREICLPDASRLIQLQHDGAACSRFVIAQDAKGATVHYSCPGAGWGRTSLHLFSPRSVSVTSQGIAVNAPFAFTAQARRIGDCPGGPAAATSISAATH